MLTADIDYKKVKKFGVLPEKPKSKPKEVDRNTLYYDRNENNELLFRAAAYWNSMLDFRERRYRSFRYYRGYQWSDTVIDPATKLRISEEQYIKNQGKVPLKQNLIRQLVKNIIGQYRGNPSKSMVIARRNHDSLAVEMFNLAMEYVHHINLGDEMGARTLEELLLSGMVVRKIGYKYMKERDIYDVFYQNVSPDRIFFNTDITDIRMNELRICGEVIDIDIEELVASFAKTKKEEDVIMDEYKGWHTQQALPNNYGLSKDTNRVGSFLSSVHPDKCRLYEIWYLKSEWRIWAHDYADASYRIVDYTLKEVEAINQQRITKGISFGMAQEDIPLIDAEHKKEQFWCVKYLTPTGYCLRELETPYEHGEHPYVIAAYPLVNGEVWGFVEDIIDQQRTINRLISLLDFIISASAKGLLMIPEECLPDGMKPEDFADEWTKANGVIVYKESKGRSKPEQISANSTNIGINEFLAINMNLIQEISGVHGANQGAAPTAGTPSSLYAQQAQNGMTNTADILQFFSTFTQRADMKVLKLISQFYDEPRYIAVAGTDYSNDAKQWDPERTKNLETEITTTQGINTPAFRQMIDDTLYKLLEMQQIDIEMFLENSTMPFAQKILASVQKRKEEMQQGQPGQIDPNVVNQVNQQADPKAMGLINRSIGKQAV